MSAQRQGGNGLEGKPTRRQFVRFAFYKIDPAWRRLSGEEAERGKQEFCRTVEAFGNRLLLRSYGLMGTRGDADFLLWQIADRLDDFQNLATEIFSTKMGPYLTIPYSYLSMTRRSVYVSPEESSREERLIIKPTTAKYLFVYPFVKTRGWYKLNQAARQGMMDEHIAIGRKYPSVKLNTTYSFGLDDQEFVVAFETDDPAHFLDLVMELRESAASMYTLRDTPAFTCVALSVRDMLDAIGASGNRVLPGASPEQPGAGAWERVAVLGELPEGASKMVYYRGEQVALFHAAGKLYALGNRCPHAGGPLADGRIEGSKVTCPYHGSQFDLASGAPCRGPAVNPAAVFQVKVEGDVIYLASPLTERLSA